MRVVFSISLLLALPIFANSFPILVMRAIDGDSVEAEIDLGLDVRLLKTVRVAHVDAPEIHGPKKEAAQKAKVFTREFCLSGPCEIRNPDYDKYGRVLSDIWCEGKSLSKALLKSGNAVPYEGGKR